MGQHRSVLWGLGQGPALRLHWFGDDTCDYVPGFLKNGTKGTAVPRIATYSCKNSNVTSIRSALIIALDTGGSDNRKVDGFCSFWENMDSIRGTKATRVGSKKSDAENALLGSVGRHLRCHPREAQEYFVGLSFRNADDSRAQYSYVAFPKLYWLVWFAARVSSRV